MYYNFKENYEDYKFNDDNLPFGNRMSDEHSGMTNLTETINPLPPGVYLDFKNNNQDRDCFVPYEEVSVKLVFKDNLYEELIDKKFSKVLFSNKSLLNEKQYYENKIITRQRWINLLTD